MTKSILNDILSIREGSPEDLQYYLRSINLTLFDPIFHNSQNLQEAKQIILYIVVAYSEDSPLVILRQDAKEEKQSICEYLQIPEFLRENLTNLLTPEVRKAATQYLEQFAGQEFKTLMFMKVQLNDFERDITNREFKESKVTGKDGEGKDIIQFYYDIKEHGKSVSESLRLAKSITALEKELKSQSTYKAIDELKEWKAHGTGKKKVTRTGSVENKIKK